jgi:HPt (histidine-containing phosphotransfer) domain-containing protein
LASGNADDFRRAAHSVKSNAATFGAAGLADLAHELESLSKEDRLDAAGGRLQEMESLFRAVARELKELNR